MKKIIAVLTVLLLAVSSAQAVTVLMDEDFDSADYHVDLDTLPGWTNNNGYDVNGDAINQIMTTYRDIEPVDVGRGIYKFEGEYSWADYSYAVSDVTLGPGEFYRFESFWHVTDGPANSNASMLTKLVHSDGRSIEYYWNANGDAMSHEIWDSSGTRILKNRIYPLGQGDIRFRIDVNADGVIGSYDLGADGSWVEQGQALATENPDFGFAGGIVEVNVQLFSYTELDWPQADTLILTVESSAPIPEPATICLLTLAGTVLLARRRR